jgi:hypothetical protein
MASAVVELAVRRRGDRDLVGGLAFSAAGVVTAVLALCARRR